MIAAGNIGCMMQIGSGTGVPVVHTVELLDWATGGPKPRALGADPAINPPQAPSALAHARRRRVPMRACPDSGPCRCWRLLPACQAQESRAGRACRPAMTAAAGMRSGG